MALVRTHRYTEVATIQQCIANTLDQIDAALDQHDRRQFVVWSKRYQSLRARLSTLLLKIAQAPEV